MNLFDRFEPLSAARAELAAGGTMPVGAVTEQILSASEGVIDGRRVILAGSNNYLGLSFDPTCIAAARQALETQGTGTTGSRVANGSFAGHQALEQELSQFFGTPGAIVFSTGFLATMGMVSTLVGPGDPLLLDADCHASIYEGARLSGAEVIRFRHNDAADLEKRLRRYKRRLKSHHSDSAAARTEEYADLLRRKLQDVLAQYDSVSKERDRLERTLDMANETERKLELEVADVTQQRDELDAKLAVVRDEHAEEIRMLRFELGEAQDTVVQTEVLKSQLASDLVDTRGFKEELERMLTDSDEQSRRRIDELETELARVTGVARDLEEKLEGRSNAINVLLAELARKSKQLDSIDDLGDVISDLDDRISDQFRDEDEHAAPSARAADRVTRVLVGKIGDKLLRFPLFKDRLTIGRTGDNDIQLNAPYISRRHAVVTTDGETTRIIDWGSKNGVFVNSGRVTEHFLKNGDIVTIGNAHFRYDERPKRDS